jgi:hypothetical protein
MSIHNSDEDIFRHYNALMLAPDTGRIRKMLVRYELFKKCLDVPGDIVECGVFKGIGVAYWLKLLDIFAHGSGKKVVGFDLFEADEKLYAGDQDRTGFVEEWRSQSNLLEKADAALSRMGVSHEYELIKGPIEQTALAYVEANRGFRISLLHLDLDVYEGTLAALKYLYPCVTRGGIIVIDEYATPGWGESDAVDEFLASMKDIQIRTMPYAHRPTSYLIKT